MDTLENTTTIFVRRSVASEPAADDSDRSGRGIPGGWH